MSIATIAIIIVSIGFIVSMAYSTRQLLNI